MAPPRHRDRGFSRRIQYGLFFGYVAAAIGVVVGIGLLLVQRYDPFAFQGIRGLALDLTAPFSTAGRSVARGAGAVGGDMGSVLTTAQEVRDLRAEAAALRTRLVQAQATERDNMRLRRILHLFEQGTRPVVTARIVGSDLSGHRRFATLAAGASEGVHPGQPVRGVEGLIGRVAETGQFAARVLLLSDGGSSVPVRVVRTGQPALVLGRGDGGIDVRSMMVGTQPFKRGDLLVTSGTGGVFPPGIPVATVAQVSGEVASGAALADPAGFDFAMVLPEAPPAPPPALPAKE